MDKTKIQQILDAIEKDSVDTGARHDAIKKTFERWEKEKKEIDRTIGYSKNIQEIINNNKDLIDAITKIEKTEHKISKYSSSAALLGIIGAAAASPVLPAAVIPAAILSGIAALGGFASKLKYQHDSIEKAKMLLDMVKDQTVESENGNT